MSSFLPSRGRIEPRLNKHKQAAGMIWKFIVTDFHDLPIVIIIIFVWLSGNHNIFSDREATLVSLLGINLHVIQRTCIVIFWQLLYIISTGPQLFSNISCGHDFGIAAEPGKSC